MEKQQQQQQQQNIIINIHPCIHQFYMTVSVPMLTMTLIMKWKLEICKAPTPQLELEVLNKHNPHNVH